MKITLVRHGQTENNFLENIQGLQNDLMNDTGRRQCKKLRDSLKNNNFDYCYTSPLIRCVETAFILVGDKTEIIRDDRLIERNIGELEGKNRNLYDIKKYWDYDLNSSDLGIENIRSIIDRCNDFLNYIKNKYDDDSNILVVTHSAPYKALRLLLNKKELKGVLISSYVDNCQFEEFTI